MPVPSISDQGLNSVPEMLKVAAEASNVAPEG
jgi:hypothetical protein